MAGASIDRYKWCMAGSAQTHKDLPRWAAAIFVLGPAAIPGAAWAFRIPAFTTGWLALGSVAGAAAVGEQLWPGRTRRFAVLLAGLTLAAMLVASAASTIVAADNYYAWTLWVPLAAPQQDLGFLLPAGGFLVVYLAGAALVVRFPWFWPVVGVAAVFAFQIAGNVADAHGVTWIS